MFDMGKRICKLRRDAHLSQKQLGEKIGESASTIGSYENDTAVPTLENAAALAEALHVSLDYLLYGEKSRTLPLQKMSENRVQLLTDLAQEFAAMGFMLGTGGTALVSRVLGEGDKEHANKYFSMITLFGILLGVILTVVGVAYQKKE